MYSDTLSHLPDPVRQQEFYDGVTVKRGLAWIIDFVLISAIALPIAFLTLIGIFFIPLIYLVVSFLYRWAGLSRRSATPGMRLMAIEFRDAWGNKLDTGQSFLHVLIYMVTMGTFLLQLASITLMMVTQRGQGINDLALGITALNRKA